ncbi:unnamed protein product [Rotaria sordida]|uniref:Calponin-homology (CH) domain-containing protein n=1 Tax=Rotaria sordida TaxID=392033 RepID=A0A814YP31_9BILA|nr:unnamed protein product [Rotaria sordida]CAF1521059.1 unnamed protein product [Rotaria sordida]
MATSSSTLILDSTSNVTVNKNKNISIYHLNRSIERALDEANHTGELNLNGRTLREFPNYKCDLSDTVFADLSRNRFIEFPRILCSFFSLERLNLYHNVIKSIPEQIVQIHMLHTLDLSRNQLAYIPPALCKLPNLEVLIINNNKLVSLPEEIGQLERLIELDVSSNDITQLPYQIGALSTLRTLNIRRNMIIELPTELCVLKLIHFDCSYNRIARLPLNLREMNSLIELNVEHNPLEMPPASICTLGLLHIMRFLLIEAMKEEKRRGILTEHEINEKYKNSFPYQTSKNLQCGIRMGKTVVPSDSGYLTTEGSEKTIGDDDSILSMSNEHTLRSEPTLMLTLADEFSKELARQKAEYERKKYQAQQLKRHLLQQLGETESQRTKAREVARRLHDEKLAKMEKQREDARRKMENSKNMQLFNFSSKDDYQKSRPWLTSNKTILTRQLSTNESAIPNQILNEPILINSINDKNIGDNSYQRSISIENATIDEYLKRSNRAVSVEPNLISGGNDIKHFYKQKTLPNGSTIQYDSTIITNRQFTLSSDTMDQSTTSSQSLMSSPSNDYTRTDISDKSLSPQHNRLTKLRYFDDRQINPTVGNVPGFHMQPRMTSITNGQYQQSPLDNPGVNPAFTIRRHLLQAKEDYIQIEQMKKTIEERVKVALPDDITYALSDGVVLCHFINQIRPRAVQSIHVPSQAVPKLSLAKCRRNVENFIEASRRLGVPEVDLCTPQDIIEEKNTVRLARHIHLLVSPESYEQTNSIMSFTHDLKLPTYDELECPVVNVSSAALRAGSFHLAKYCDLQFKEFILCRQEEQDPRKCLNEGKNVSLCAINFFHKVRESCNDTFTTFWTCLDNAREGEMSFNSCKEEQKAFELCSKNKMNLERPEPGYFSMIRMHDSKRPIPSDPFRIGSLERHPPKLDVPDPPLLSQANEYPEAKIGMKFGHRKPWMFEAKLWD